MPTKPKTKALAKRDSAPEKYLPPARRPSYDEGFNNPAPALDPQTRHALVTLEERVRTFDNLEDRIQKLLRRVREAEKVTVDLPEPAWHQLQFSMSTLQKEFRERVPPIERHFDDLKLMLARLERLEAKVEQLAKAVDELLKGSSH